jgi:hypothetical protein
MELLLSSGTVSIHGFRRYVYDNIPANVGGTARLSLKLNKLSSLLALNINMT